MKRGEVYDARLDPVGLAALIAFRLTMTTGLAPPCSRKGAEQEPAVPPPRRTVRGIGQGVKQDPQDRDRLGGVRRLNPTQARARSQRSLGPDDAKVIITHLARHRGAG